MMSLSPNLLILRPWSPSWFTNIIMLFGLYQKMETAPRTQVLVGRNLI